jgi:hypothetical protein
MLSNEAFIYDRLSQLQAECVPEVFGFFGCEDFDVLVMELVGRTLEKMENLSVPRRCVVYNNAV